MTYKYPYILGSVICICITLSSFAQNNDSIAIANGTWKITEIIPGVLLKKIQFTDSSLFNSNQYISVLEVDKKVIGKKNGLRFKVAAGEKLTPTTGFAEDNKALAAVNGSFFSLGKPYNSVDYIRIEGKELSPNEYKADSVRLFHQEGAVVIKNGKLAILKPSGKLSESQLLYWEKTIKADDIMTSGPLLRINGKDELLKTTSHFTTRHPRTALATRKDGTVLLIAIDGRSKEAAGMSLAEVQKVFRWLGAKDLISLDGGGSTAMYLKGHGIVNHPSDNKTFDNKGERKVANVILLKTIPQ